MEYYFKETFSRYDPKKPAEKKKIAQELLNVIKDISNPVEQSHWLKLLASRIGTEEKILTDILQKVENRRKKSGCFRITPEKKSIARKALKKKYWGSFWPFRKNAAERWPRSRCRGLPK